MSRPPKGGPHLTHPYLYRVNSIDGSSVDRTIVAGHGPMGTRGITDRAYGLINYVKRHAGSNPMLWLLPSSNHHRGNGNVPLRGRESLPENRANESMSGSPREEGIGHSGGKRRPRARSVIGSSESSTVERCPLVGGGPMVHSGVSAYRFVASRRSRGSRRRPVARCPCSGQIHEIDGSVCHPTFWADVRRVNRET